MSARYLIITTYENGRHDESKRSTLGAVCDDVEFAFGCGDPVATSVLIVPIEEN
jgi:hypothetical protein